MHFLLADTFTSSLARLTGDEQTLAAALRVKLERLAGGDGRARGPAPSVADRIRVRDITRVGIDLHESLLGPFNEAPDEVVTGLIHDAMDHVGADPHVGPDNRRSVRAATGGRPYALAEWRDVVDAWQIRTPRRSRA